jgi:hypothetical protein
LVVPVGGPEKLIRLIWMCLAIPHVARIIARLSRDNYNAPEAVNTFLVLPRNCNDRRARISRESLLPLFFSLPRPARNTLPETAHAPRLSLVFLNSPSQSKPSRALFGAIFRASRHSSARDARISDTRRTRLRMDAT